MSDRNYVKLFSTIATSSLWNEALATRIVWITILACKNAQGEVIASTGALARLANVSPEECKSALEVLLSPDNESRTKAHEGRRLEVIDGGWRVLNHRLYQVMSSKEDEREYQAKKYQERKAIKDSGSSPVKECQDPSSDSRHTDTDTDTDKSIGVAKDEPKAKKSGEHLRCVNLAVSVSALWEQTFGGKPPMGRLLRALKPVLSGLPHEADDDIAKAFQAYCKQVEPKFASVESFLQKWKSYLANAPQQVKAVDAHSD